jgi:hypothetical protein
MDGYREEKYEVVFFRPVFILSVVLNFTVIISIREIFYLSLINLLKRVFTDDNIDPRICRNPDLMFYEGPRDQIMNEIHHDFINFKVLGHLSLQSYL